MVALAQISILARSVCLSYVEHQALGPSQQLSWMFDLRLNRRQTETYRHSSGLIRYRISRLAARTGEFGSASNACTTMRRGGIEGHPPPNA